MQKEDTNEKRIEEIVRVIIKNMDFAEFLAGRGGEFDRIVSSVIRRAVRKYGRNNTAHVLILPYMGADCLDNWQDLRKYYDNYDEIEICPEPAEEDLKDVLQIRSRKMIDRSDLVICYIEHSGDGAYKAAQYTKQIGRRLLNVAESDIFNENK